MEKEVRGLGLRSKSWRKSWRPCMTNMLLKRAGNGESSSSSANIPSIPVQAGYESFLSSRSTRISKSELRNYLEDAVEPRNKALDLLGWWKDNAPRYPIMAKIARRFLTIPATSVSSESTFSTTGRILGMSTRTNELWI